MKQLQAFSLGLALVAAQLAAAQTRRPQIVVETGTADSVTAVAFSPDGRFLASANANQTVKLWNLVAGRRHLTLQGHEAAVTAVAFSPDGNLLASGGADKTIRLWDTSTGRQAATLAGHADGVSSVSFGRDRLLASGAGSEIKIWDTAGGREVRSLAGHTLGVFAVAFAADGKTLVSGSPDSVRVWDTETGVNQKTFRDSARPFTSVAVSRDGKHVAGGLAGASIGLWDVASGIMVRQFTGHVAAATSLAFSPEGKLLASGGADGSLKLWDVTTGALPRSLPGHASPVRSAAFSHDGKLLASGDGGPETKLWGVAGRQDLASLVAPGERDWIVFTPVGLYDGTPGGMRSVSFKQAGQSIQIDSFFEQLYTPRLLAQVVLSNRADSTRPYRAGAFGGIMDRVSGAGARPAPARAPSPSTSASSPSTSASSPSPGRAGGFGTIHATRRLGLDLTGVIKLPPLVKIELPADAAPPTLKRAADAAQHQDRTRGIGPQPASADLATLKVTATDQGGGVDEIRIYRNDKLIVEDKLARDRERGLVPGATPAAAAPPTAPGAAPTVTKSYSVALAPGSNVFRAVALNADRTESSPAEVRMERAAAQATVTLHLLAVGLNEYKNPKYNLNFGRADAQSFADELERRGRGIFKAINKHVLLDREATRESVEAAFARISAEAQPGDAFVFFYAGHGVMSEGTPGAPAEFHLVPHDVTQLYGNDEMLAAKGVGAGLLREWCRRIPAQKQLIVLDACQAGGAVDTFSTLRGVPEEKAIMQLARSVGIIILAATGTEQSAVEFAKLGHGAFTYALLQGLSGQADGGSRPDGKITVKELEAYLNDTLPELTRLHRGTPQFPNSYSRGQDFPLGVK